MEPRDEEKRLKRLHDMGLLDSPEDRLLRGLVEQALTLVPGTSIAAVSLVDANRQWFNTIIGLDVKETPRSVSFCSHTIETNGVLVVEDAASDGRFANNPLVTSGPAIRFYAGIKLTNGIGAFCVIGRQPRRATESEIANLAKLAHYADIQLLAQGTLFNLPKASGKAG